MKTNNNFTFHNDSHKSDDFQSLDKTYYLQVARRYPITLEHGRGAHVWDVEGNEYIDALAGIAVNSVGHCHPKVVAAIQQQAANLIHISNFYTSRPQVLLARKLVEKSGLDRIFFSNSGAEANEAAIKMARKYSHAYNKGGKIISMQGCFHGRTLGTLATGPAKNQKGFEPVPSGYQQVAFNDFEDLKSHIDDDTAAIILEPLQGEGGIHLARQDYLEQVRTLCDENNILLIFDEIQCGMGRTGKFFAHEHHGVKPDIITMAKALGGGVPIGAAIVSQKVADEMNYGDHGTTFGGNPLACAASLATLEVLEEENLAEKAAAKGERILEKLRQAAKSENAIVDVRGKGLMIGIELNMEGKPVIRKMLEKNILGNVTAGKVLRLVPPLVINDEDLDTVVEHLLQSIRDVREG